ncbi:TP901 family phage tail tape measure protein [Microbacterium testaceum]|uniref:phage tail tape measure protein n=1 Tax=Microbacterium TaxID=33882 RepID=UPI0027820D7D|nr:MULTISPECIES: phage tail tape measure protein [Microbacterium]MDQ1111135.1 TP901 family phage tail tape measure protein [Microbacterium testaceum]MDR6098326.1 TP901 family phage tail tape measure protein [Microbacterium sp. SORGH_AS_0454]
MFDAGALIFKIQTAGEQTFQSNMASAEQSVEKLGRTSAEATPKVEKTGDAVDKTGKKAKEAKAPLDEQAKSTKGVGDESETASKKQSKQATSTEEQIAASKELSKVLLVSGAAVGAVVALSVAKFTEFDKAMSQTRAATMATAAEQKELGEAALEAGADTAYSASEAAAAEEELAKAGQTVSDIVGGSLNGALALAAAGQLQVARSAEIMATTLTQFRLPAREAAHVSDVLAAGAGKAQGSVDDLALALSYVGPLAGSVGLSLDETAGTIAYFATQGIIGEKAGTSLRGVLASLQAPSMAATKEMEKYNITAFDANGNMLSLAGIADQLQKNLSGLTEEERLAALGRIFGNESLNAATLLYEGGSAAVEKWTAAVDDSGYAAEQAAIRQDNLAGDIEKLGGAFDTAFIRTGAGANDILREMVQLGTGLVDLYGELPAPVQATALALGVAATAILLFAGGAVQVRARLIELQAEFAKTNASMRTTALVGAGAALALSGIVTVIGILAAKQADMNASTEAYADTLDEATGAMTEYTRKSIAKSLADSGSFEGARQAGISQDELTEALFRGGKAYEDVMEKLRAAHDASGGWNATIGNTINAVKDTNVQLQDAKQRHEDLKAATEGTNAATAAGTDTTKTAAAAYVEAAQGADALEGELHDLIDAVNEANGVGQDAVSANIAYKDAVAQVDETIQKARDGADGYALTLDTNTEAGRNNLGMLNELAQKAQDAAEKQYSLDGNTQNYRSSLEAGRQALIDRARDLGYNADEAEALANQIYRIPSETEWKIIANTQFAQQQVDSYISKNTGREIILKIAGVPVAQGLGGSGGITQADGGKVEFYADGGRRGENHVAQFARAGTYRVWAEDETGGEWYLPNSPAKRDRSLVIAKQMLSEWGFDMVPKGAAVAVSAPSDAGQRQISIVQNITAEQTDPRIQARQWGDEFRRAVASTT